MGATGPPIRLRYGKLHPGTNCFGCEGAHGDHITLSKLLFTLDLPGQLPSGKNAVKTTRKGRRYPGERFMKWRTEMLFKTFRGAGPLTDPVDLRITYTPGDLRRRDVDGMLGAIMHLLEKGGWLKDDALVKDVNWKELELDRENPQAIVEVWRR